MGKIKYNVTIPVELWNDIKDTLENVHIGSVQKLLERIHKLEPASNENSEQEDEEEDYVEPVLPRVARRRADSIPVSGERFYHEEKRKYGIVTVIPNPPRMKGLDKYHESVTDVLHNRLVWSTMYDAWVPRKKKGSNND